MKALWLKFQEALSSRKFGLTLLVICLVVLGALLSGWARITNETYAQMTRSLETVLGLYLAGNVIQKATGKAEGPSDG